MSRKKRQLEFVGEKTGGETPPLPSFPEELLAENREMEAVAEKRRKMSSPDTDTGTRITLEIACWT